MAKVLRLLMPQWQGGDNPLYSFGARLLAWLAPESKDAVFVEVPVTSYGGGQLDSENGVVAQSVLLSQLDAAHKIIKEQQPEKIIVFGGDCLVSQAPFAYLNERYDGKLGVLWLDAHPDVSAPSHFNHEHAMVLGNLLGEGDGAFAAKVKRPLDPGRVMYGGLKPVLPYEAEVIERLGIRKATPQDLAQDSEPVLDWIQENDIRRLAVHFDLDVLDPKHFRSQLFASPEPIDIDAERGEMTFGQVGRVLHDVAGRAELVGFSVTEHLPWDAANLRDFLKTVPIFG